MACLCTIQDVIIFVVSYVFLFSLHIFSLIIDAGVNLPFKLSFRSEALIFICFSFFITYVLYYGVYCVVSLCLLLYPGNYAMSIVIRRLLIVSLSFFTIISYNDARKFSVLMIFLFTLVFIPTSTDSVLIYLDDPLSMNNFSTTDFVVVGGGFIFYLLMMYCLLCNATVRLAVTKHEQPQYQGVIGDYFSSYTRSTMLYRITPDMSETERCHFILWLRRLNKPLNELTSMFSFFLEYKPQDRYKLQRGGNKFMQNVLDRIDTLAHCSVNVRYMFQFDEDIPNSMSVEGGVFHTARGYYGSFVTNLKTDFDLYLYSLYEMPYCTYLILRNTNFREYLYQLFVEPIYTLVKVLLYERLTGFEAYLLLNIVAYATQIPVLITVSANVSVFLVSYELWVQFYHDPFTFWRMFIMVLVAALTSPLFFFTSVLVKQEEVYKERDLKRARLFAWLEAWSYVAMYGFTFMMIIFRPLVIIMHDLASRMPRAQGICLHWFWNTFVPWLVNDRMPTREAEYQGLVNPHSLVVRNYKLYNLKGVEVTKWRPLRYFQGWERFARENHLSDHWSLLFHKTDDLRYYYVYCVLALQGNPRYHNEIIQLNELLKVKRQGFGDGGFGSKDVKDVAIVAILGKIAYILQNFTTIQNFLMFFATEITLFGLKLNSWHSFTDMDAIYKFMRPAMDTDTPLANYQSFMDSSAYREISGFLTSLLVTLGFSSSKWISVDAPRRFASAIDLIKYVSTLPVELYGSIKEWYVTGNVPSYFLGGMASLTSKANALLASPLPKGDDPEQRRKREAMVKEAKELISEIERLAPRDKPIPEVHLRLLHGLRLIARPPENQIRPEPFVLVLYGAAGTGKSSLVTALHAILARSMGWSSDTNPATNSCYSFRGGKHLDGVQDPLTKHTFVFEDFLQSNDPEEQSTEMLMFHKLCGTITTPMPMASIEGKMQTNDWRPNLVIICTNLEGVFNQHLAGDLQSYARRVNLYVEVKAKTIFSMSNIPTDTSREFDFYRLTVKNGNLIRKNVVVAGIPHTGSYSKFLSLVSKAICSSVKYSSRFYDLSVAETTCKNGLPMTYHCNKECDGGCDFKPNDERMVFIDEIQDYKPPERQGFAEPTTREYQFAAGFLTFIVVLYSPSVINTVVLFAFLLFVFIMMTLLLVVSVIDRRYGLIRECLRMSMYFIYVVGLRKFLPNHPDVTQYEADTDSYGSIGALYAYTMRDRWERQKRNFLTVFGVLLATYILNPFGLLRKNAQSSARRPEIQGDIFEVPANNTLKEENVRQNKLAEYMRGKIVMSSSEMDCKDVIVASLFEVISGDSRVAYGLRCGDYMVTTNHSMCNGAVFLGVQKTGVSYNNHYQVRLTASLDESEILDVDLIAVRIPSLPAKNLSGVCMSRSDQSLIKHGNGFVYCEEYVGSGFAWHNVSFRKAAYTLEGTPHEGYEVTYPFHTYVGLCGVPIVYARENRSAGVNCAFFGIHHAGVAGQNIGFFRPVYKEMFVKLTTVTVVEMQNHSPPVLQGVGNRGVNNLELAGVSLGNLDKMNRVRSNLRLSSIASHFPHITSKFAVPDTTSYLNGEVGPLYAHWNHKPKLGRIDQVAANKALEDLISHDLKYFEDFYREQQPLSVSQAVLGIPGAVTSMNLSKSSGYGFQGAKSNYIKVDHETGKVELDQRIVDQLNEYKSLALSAGSTEISIAVIVDTFVKDEVRKLGKCYRWIGVFPIFFLILCRMFLQIFFFPWRKLPTKSECWVGVNATGLPWTELGRHLEKSDDEFYWCIDFKFWDRTFSELSRHYFNTYMSTLIGHTRWPDSFKIMAVAVLRSLSYLYVIIHVSMFAMSWYVQSGEPFTVYVNSWFQRFLIRYWYYKVTKADIGTFELNVKPNTYGDDGLGRAKRLPGLNQLSLAEAVNDFGCIATSASKGELKEEATWEELSFLKRGIVRDEEFGGYRGPLEIESIEKSLCWYSLSSNINEQEWLVAVLDNATREYFLHGRKVFQEKVMELTDIAKLHGIPYTPLQFEEYLASWHSGSFTTWSL